MWAFEAYAEGLLTSATNSVTTAADEPPQQLHKSSRNNDLFDAAGQPLAADKIHDVTTWRTHHAFGGRCALVKTTQEKEAEALLNEHESCTADPPMRGSPSGPRWAEQAWAAYQNWSVAFRLRSTTAEEEPHILLSVAPAYFPLLSSPTGEALEPDANTVACLPAAPSAEEQTYYNHRLLDTPLIWEEAYALSVECTPRGVFLWSDHWELFGKKIADRCLEVQKKTQDVSEVVPVEVDTAANAEAKTYHGAVRLRFNAGGGKENDGSAATDSPVPTLAVDMQQPSSSATVVNANEESMWQHVMDIPLPMDALAQKTAFRPHVTLLESGDSVEIIS